MKKSILTLLAALAVSCGAQTYVGGGAAFQAVINGQTGVTFNNPTNTGTLAADNIIISANGKPVLTNGGTNTVTTAAGSSFAFVNSPFRYTFARYYDLDVSNNDSVNEVVRCEFDPVFVLYQFIKMSNGTSLAARCYAPPANGFTNLIIRSHWRLHTNDVAGATVHISHGYKQYTNGVEVGAVYDTGSIFTNQFSAHLDYVHTSLHTNLPNAYNCYPTITRNRLNGVNNMGTATNVAALLYVELWQFNQ